jgi:cobalt-zinc-cadmium efflux system membrane fusion protein
MKRVWLTAIGVSLLALAACGEKAVPQAAPKPADRAVALADASLKFLTIEAVGLVSAKSYGPIPGRLAMRPQALSSVGAPTSGRIVSVLVRPGENVAAGKPLFTIQSADAAAARSSLEQALARTAAAEESLRRYTEMVAKGVGLEMERFEAETKAREARAELARARRTSELLGAGEGGVVSVRAPGAGAVMSVKASVGAVVAPGGEALVEIADTSRLWVVADVPEADTALVTRGQRVVVSIPNARRQMSGSVDGIGSRIETDTRRLPVYILLDGDLRGLTPGMQAELQFTTGTETLNVPVTAVLIKEGKRRVIYVQRADGRFEPRDVRTGAVSGGRVPIIEGLKPGERVVVKGALLLDTEAEQLL